MDHATDHLVVEMKEKFYLCTENYCSGLTTPPGQILTITANPIGSMLSDEEVESKWRLNASPLAMTASRFRDFLYAGTQFSMVPAATNAAVDPAHLSEVNAGSSNYLNPVDVNNCIHYRRWLGGNYTVPSVKPTGEPTKEEPKVPTYDLYDAQLLDVAWLNDPRFTHIQVSDGFSFESVPMETGTVTAAHSTDAVFAYYDPGMIACSKTQVASAQPRGLMMLRGGELKRRLWGPNPLAGFIYNFSSDYKPEGPQFTVSGINPNFPWFADTTDVDTSTLQLATLYKLVLDSYINPLCILRLPPAYGSRYFWTVYMKHTFVFRHPYLLDGTWTAGQVKEALYDQADRDLRVVDSNGHTTYVPRYVTPKNVMGVYHAAPTDPYAYDNEIYKLTLADQDAVLYSRFGNATGATVDSVVDYVLSKDKEKEENVDRETTPEDSVGSQPEA